MEFSRRTFMKVAALSGATLASDSGVKYVDKLVPFVNPPEKLRPVDWHSIATTCRECPAGCGMHVRHRDGRITKAEGNPEHPVNQGGLCARGQSSLQGVYDPDRVNSPHTRDRRNAPFKQEKWESALLKIGDKLQQANGRIALISRLETGTLAEIFFAFTSTFNSNRLLFYEAFNYGPLRKAHAALFGRPVVPLYRLDAADYIISFGADFLETWVSNVQFSWQYANMHELQNGKIGRYDYVGPLLSMTAANADRFIQVSPGREKEIAFGMLRIMQEEGLVRAGNNAVQSLLGNFDPRAATNPSFSLDDLRNLTRRFANAKASVAIGVPMGASGAEAESLAMAVTLLNVASGRSAAVIDFDRPHALSDTATDEQFSSFLQSITQDDILIIHKTNPVYTNPGSEEFLKKAGTIIYCGTLLDETAMIADWFLPVNDDLETWGDYEPWKGIHSLLQPSMQPIAASMPVGDLFLKLASISNRPLKRPGGTIPQTTYEWMQDRWGKVSGTLPLSDDIKRVGGSWREFTSRTRQALPQLKTTLVQSVPTQTTQALPANEAKLWLWASIMLFDGRTANRGWLQEAPEPVSTIMWNNCVDINPKKASALGIRDGDVIELIVNQTQSIQAPARVTEDIAEDAVALCYGQGHSALGSIAKNIGANAFRMLTPAAINEGLFGRVTIKKTAGRERLYLGMTTKDQHDRELLQWKALDAAKTMKPGPLILPLPEAYSKDRDLYKGHVHNYHRWAMAIDLQRCIGCGACAIACYAENNLSVIGKDGLAGQRGLLRTLAKAGIKGTNEGRIMAWLRVVPYRHPEDPRRIGFLPMLCQHCDSAPCEPVCPVFAAVNNEEGLNAQIYNRCIGTRYCSNNCPYKVRRFNWLNTYWKPPLDLQLNPEVTVRSRGVMEKCTFCIQRIRNAEFRAKRERRKVRDGEIVPACAQTCPAKVFTFGDLLDPDSAVSRITRNHPRRYHVLEELNTKPAITYLFRITQEKA